MSVETDFFSNFNKYFILSGWHKQQDDQAAGHDGKAEVPELAVVSSLSLPCSYISVNWGGFHTNYSCKLG